MRPPQSDASYRSFFIIVLLVLANSAIASAACHVITPTGSGSTTGSDWGNACAGFTGSCSPSNMIRGDSYYVGKGGPYPSTVFNTPNSGTTVITIQAPTATDHCTDTGFSASTMVGQAAFGPISLVTPHWVFNGVYRGANWNSSSGYGFAVRNNDGSNQAINSSSAILVTASDVVIKYTDVAGSHNYTGACDGGVWFQFGHYTNEYVGYSHIHDIGAFPVVTIDNTDYGVIEYNWLERNNYLSNCHSEGIAARGEGGGLNYLTIRYNYIENTPGTAPGVATPVTGPSTSSNWYIYGNVIFFNLAEDNGYPSGRYGGGDGVMELLGDTGATWSNVHFYSNTFANIGGLQATAIQYGGGWPANISSTEIRNNVWFNSGTAGGEFVCTVSSGTCGNPTISNNTLDSTNRFVNVPNGGQPGAVGQDDFHLKSDTSPWTALADVTLPNGFVETLSKDMDGVKRTSSQGAFQFINGTGGQPTAPSGLAALVR